LRESHHLRGGSTQTHSGNEARNGGGAVVVTEWKNVITVRAGGLSLQRVAPAQEKRRWSSSGDGLEEGHHGPCGGCGCLCHQSCRHGAAVPRGDGASATKLGWHARRPLPHEPLYCVAPLYRYCEPRFIAYWIAVPTRARKSTFRRDRARTDPDGSAKQPHPVLVRSAQLGGLPLSPLCQETPTRLCRRLVS
jgi:hypothetical protein